MDSKIQPHPSDILSQDKDAYDQARELKTKFGDSISCMVVILNHTNFNLSLEEVKNFYGDIYNRENYLSKLEAIKAQSSLGFLHAKAGWTLHGACGYVKYNIGGTALSILCGYQVPQMGSNCMYVEIMDKGKVSEKDQKRIMSILDGKQLVQETQNATLQVKLQGKIGLNQTPFAEFTLSLDDQPIAKQELLTRPLSQSQATTAQSIQSITAQSIQSTLNENTDPAQCKIECDEQQVRLFRLKATYFNGLDIYLPRIAKNRIGNVEIASQKIGTSLDAVKNGFGKAYNAFAFLGNGIIKDKESVEQAKKRIKEANLTNLANKVQWLWQQSESTENRDKYCRQICTENSKNFYLCQKCLYYLLADESVSEQEKLAIFKRTCLSQTYQQAIALKLGIRFQLLQDVITKNDEERIKLFEQFHKDYPRSIHPWAEDKVLVDFIAYINIFSYNFSRIARALNYQYPDAKEFMQKLYINVSYAHEFNQCIKEIWAYISPLLVARLETLQNSIPAAAKQANWDKLIAIMNSKDLHQLCLWYQAQHFGDAKENENNFRRSVFDKDIEINQHLQEVDVAITAVFIFARHEIYFPVQITHTSKIFNNQIGFIVPFFGYAGKPASKLLDTNVSELHHQGKDQNFDLRGVLALTEQSNKIALVCWHGSSQEYDWFSNLQLSLEPLAQYFPDCAINTVQQSQTNSKLQDPYSIERVHRGFATVVQRTLQTQQPHLNDQKLGDFLQQNYHPDTILYTGHSLGAALAHISAFVDKFRNPGKTVRAYILSAPRSVNKALAVRVNQAFQVFYDKQNQKAIDLTNLNDCNLYRQNVYGDPVPLSFSSPSSLFIMIRRTIEITEDVMNALFKRLLNSRIFQDIQKDMQSQLTVSKLVVNLARGIEQFKDVCKNASFKEALRQITTDGSQLRAQFGGDLVVSDTVLNKIFQLIYLQLCGQLRDFVKEMPELADYIPTMPNFDLKSVTPAMVARSNFCQQEGWFVEALVYFMGNASPQRLESLIWETIEAPEKWDGKLDNSERPRYIKYCYEKSIPYIIKEFMLKYVCKTTYGKELFMYGGGILEGALCFMCDYGDTGVLLLEDSESLTNESKFHLNYQDMLLFVEQNISNELIKLKQAAPIKLELMLYRIRHTILSYYAPYHYGKAELSGSFDYQLIVGTKFHNLLQFGYYYQRLSPKSKVMRFNNCGLKVPVDLKNLKAEYLQQYANNQGGTFLEFESEGKIAAMLWGRNRILIANQQNFEQIDYFIMGLMNLLKKKLITLNKVIRVFYIVSHWARLQKNQKSQLSDLPVFQSHDQFVNKVIAQITGEGSKYFAEGEEQIVQVLNAWIIEHDEIMAGVKRAVLE